MQFVFHVNFASNTEDEEYCVMFDHRVEQLHGIVVTVFSIVDDCHPQLLEASSHQLQQKFAQHLSLQRLGQHFVAFTYREMNVEGLIESTKVFWLTYTT